MEETGDGGPPARVGRSGLATTCFLCGNRNPFDPALPLGLAVPWERLRQSPPKRKARSARWFVGSTPHWYAPKV